MSHYFASIRGAESVPPWVPESALLYLLHTETGHSIRALARETGVHASTVLRRIRQFEIRRDDDLVDAALRGLGRRLDPAEPAGSPLKETRMTDAANDLSEVTDRQLKQDGLRVLRRLCETGALLAVSAQMDKAVVVRDDETGAPTRTAVVERQIAEAMALKGWIACDAPGRISRYHITRAGRAAVGAMLAEAENRASGFADAQAVFVHETSADDAGPRRVRYGVAESPLSALARRRDRDGSRFVTEDMVRAGERLREDFELARLGPRAMQDWDRFLTGAERTCPGAQEGPAGGADAARRRVENALRDLGPGLGDIALRCCCHLEGLERAEKRLGWSARSGKVVLRIALQRLKHHYDMLGDAGGLIG
ncbi:helix-turn-helix domain containing protein [Roseovarius spongiae]|uniref:Helix-turn-helix domain containing protein n=1 Tax=Roseovarius spongiae TaxID=2320272 RepID=A0A3A8BA32_9RHOB|nr:DUF6456 domain-containing protein [Roseovarius spongiae]RKF15283.1 helix-turn-helix domain containing protein [Roseovarius spongiae]